MATQDAFEHIVAALQDAALDDSQWPRAMALIDAGCEMLASHWSLFAGIAGAPDYPGYQYGLICSHGEIRYDAEEEYIEDFSSHDERVPRLFRLPLGRVVPNTDVYTEQELKTSATYNDFLPRYDGQNQVIVRMNGPERYHLLWTLTRGHTQGDWRSEHIDLIQALLPHLRHAICVRHALVKAETLGSSLTGLLDRKSLGALLLGQNGSIIEANDRAREILCRGDGLSDKNGFLHARSAVDNTQLGKLLAKVLPKSGRQASSGSMAVKRPFNPLPLVLHVTPVVSRRVGFRAGPVRAIVLIVDPHATPDIDAALVATALGLTPAESQVAISLAQGHSLRDIAVTTHRAYGSVRWLLKQIYAKTGLTRQADLVRVVLSLANLPNPTA